jgi:nicotinate-nucleotide adenylyltransferase
VKTVVIGGTFNPVHIGHLYLAEEVRTQLGYNQVIFVPSHIPAHKNPDCCTPPEDRLEMLRRAVKDSEIIVDDCEIRRGGISYTYETLLELAERYHIDGKPGLVVGDDLVEGLPQWKRWEELQQMVDLIIAHRLYEQEVECVWPHNYIENLILPISSSAIRERVNSKEVFRYLVTDEVYSYIVDNGLYTGC